jgi:hypothetical protein
MHEYKTFGIYENKLRGHQKIFVCSYKLHARKDTPSQKQIFAKFNKHRPTTPKQKHEKGAPEYQASQP